MGKNCGYGWMHEARTVPMPKPFRKSPSLHNGLDHVLFRHPDQWKSVFSEEVAHLMGGNAQGRLWHSEGAKEETIENMTEELGNLCVPAPDFDDGQHDRIPFFDPPTIELMRRVVCEDVRHRRGPPSSRRRWWTKRKRSSGNSTWWGGLGQITH